MKYLDVLRSQLAALDTERTAVLTDMEAIPTTSITEQRSMTDAESAAFDAAKAKVTALDEQRAQLGARITELEQIEQRAAKVADKPELQVIRKDDPADVLENRSATPKQLADAITRSVEENAPDISPDALANFQRIVRKHSKDEAWARSILARSTETYVSAFEKYLASPTMPNWTPEEQRAIVVGTNTSGGFLVPTVIDPTLIYTNTGSDNVIRQISRVVTLTGDANKVNVISSAGVTASWDAELVEVSDDSPEIARPDISIHKAAAFIVASIEATQDMGALFNDSGNGLRGLFQDAKDRLEGAAFATGSGSGQPFGIFTALDANTNVELTTTTAATVGEVDLHSVYRNLGGRWRRRATWISNPLFTLAVKRLGTAVGSSFTGDLREAPSDRILGRPWYEVEDAPNAQTTTALDNILVFGDFSNYVIVDKPASMAVEYIPHVFSGTNGRPIGARGWYAWWRTGADSVNDVAFRLLQDKTSA